MNGVVIAGKVTYLDRKPKFWKEYLTRISKSFTFTANMNFDERLSCFWAYKIWLALVLDCLHVPSCGATRAAAAVFVWGADVRAPLSLWWRARGLLFVTSYFRSIVSSKRQRWAWAEYLSPAPVCSPPLWKQRPQTRFKVRVSVISLFQLELLIRFLLVFDVAKVSSTISRTRNFRVLLSPGFLWFFPQNKHER